MNRDRLYVVHIAESIVRIEEYVSGGREPFMESTLIQDAVIRNLQVMAESTQRLSASLKEAHPEVDWSGISGMRNILVHDYLGVNMARVWEAIEQDLPILRGQMETISRELESAP